MAVGKTPIFQYFCLGLCNMQWIKFTVIIYPLNQPPPSREVNGKLELFRIEYANELGQITVQGANTDNVVAPGTSVDYDIRLRNNDDVIIDFLLTPNVEFLTADEVTEELVQRLVDNKLNLDIYYPRLNREVVEKLHANGILVNCWTCDKPEDAEKLIEMGVDYITSNILE